MLIIFSMFLALFSFGPTIPSLRLKIPVNHTQFTLVIPNSNLLPNKTPYVSKLMTVVKPKSTLLPLKTSSNRGK